MENYSSLPKRRQGTFTLAASSIEPTFPDDYDDDDEGEEFLGQLINNSSRTAQLRRELRHGKSEEEEAARSNCPHPTHAIVNPIETHDKPSNYNDEVRKRKSSQVVSVIRKWRVLLRRSTYRNHLHNEWMSCEYTKRSMGM